MLIINAFMAAKRVIWKDSYRKYQEVSQWGFLKGILVKIKAVLEGLRKPGCQ